MLPILFTALLYLLNKTKYIATHFIHALMNMRGQGRTLGGTFPSDINWLLAI